MRPVSTSITTAAAADARRAAPARRSSARRRPGSARRCCPATAGLRRRPSMMSRMSVLGRPRRSTTIFWKPAWPAQVAVPLPLDAGAADQIAGAVALVLLGAQLLGRRSRSCSRARAPPACPYGYDRRGTETILTPGQVDAGLDRRHRLARDVLGHQQRALARARRASPGGAAAISLPHVHRLVAVHAQQRPQPREHLGRHAAAASRRRCTRAAPSPAPCPCGRGSARAPPAAARSG